MKADFSHQQRIHQENWRKSNISTTEKGFQNKKSYEHIVPRTHWEETLWIGIRKELPIYLKSKDIQAHSGTHNLLSSWVACANLYFPVRLSESLRNLMTEFLKLKVSGQITAITDVELEFAFPQNDPLHPSTLLGEADGSRGSGQTSPDVAFIVKLKLGKGFVLTESKYTEHSFYKCSARRTTSRGVHKGNSNPARCMKAANSIDYKTICHQTNWGRKYWSNLSLSNKGKNTLKRCPAATAGYQLFRQQALAEGIAKTGNYFIVASTVAFDDRNSDLKGCLKGTGISDFQTGWGEIFEGKSIYRTWTHQEWVEFVRKNQRNREFNDWLKYLEERYGY